VKASDIILILIGLATLWVLVRQKTGASGPALAASSQTDPLTLVNQIADRVVSQMKTTTPPQPTT
jgi:hypothetical protein